MSCLRGSRARPDVSIIVVVYNTRHLVEPFFTALDAATDGLSVETIVINNASSDGPVDAILIVNTDNLSFERANDRAAQMARGRYVLLLNTDAFVSSDTLVRRIHFMDVHRDCGVLGVRLLGDDGTQQSSCHYVPTQWNLFVQASGLRRFFPRTRPIDDPAGDPSEYFECDWVPGDYYLLRRDVIERVALFDPRYFRYYEEIDHCRAVKSTCWRVVDFPATRVRHCERESDQFIESLRIIAHQVSASQIERELLFIRKCHRMKGIAIHLLLARIADLINEAKGIVGRSKWRTVRNEMYPDASLWTILTNTKFGLRPTL